MCECKSLHDLAAACQALGLEWLPNETRWRWFSRYMDDYHGTDAAYQHGIKPEEYGWADAGVIRVEGCEYDIGCYKRGGQYQLVYDHFREGVGLEKRLGKGLPKLKQAIAEAATTRVLKRQGYMVRRQVTTDGSIVLTCYRRLIE